jgi:membrane protease YdiL (CAAX protease family)
MYVAFLVLLVAWTIVINVIDALESEEPINVDVTEKSEFKSFIVDIMFIWGPAIVVLILSFIGGISFQDLGFRPVNFGYNTWFTVITLIVSGVVFAYYVGRLILSLTSAKFREKHAIKFKDYEDVPRTTKERKQHTLLVFSTATCEELIDRGFAVFLLQAVFPDIPTILVIIITSVLFGLSHLYQGFRGVVDTTIFGILSVSLFLVTGNLIFSMLLHFVADFSYTFFLSEEQAEQ